METEMGHQRRCGWEWGESWGWGQGYGGGGDGTWMGMEWRQGGGQEQEGWEWDRDGYRTGMGQGRAWGRLQLMKAGATVADEGAEITTAAVAGALMTTLSACHGGNESC